MLSRDVDAMLARLEDSVQVDGEQAIAFTSLSDTMQVLNSKENPTLPSCDTRPRGMRFVHKGSVTKDPSKCFRSVMHSLLWVLSPVFLVNT